MFDNLFLADLVRGLPASASVGFFSAAGISDEEAKTQEINPNLALKLVVFVVVRKWKDLATAIAFTVAAGRQPSFSKLVAGFAAGESITLTLDTDTFIGLDSIVFDTWRLQIVFQQPEPVDRRIVLLSTKTAVYLFNTYCN